MPTAVIIAATIGFVVGIMVAQTVFAFCRAKKRRGLS